MAEQPSSSWPAAEVEEEPFGYSGTVGGAANFGPPGLEFISRQQHQEAEIAPDIEINNGNLGNVKGPLRYGVDIEDNFKHSGETELAFSENFYSPCYSPMPMSLETEIEDSEELLQLLEDYKCPICLDTFINTVKVDCCSGHRFCNFCIQSWISLQRHLVTECPVCRGPIFGKALDLKTDSEIRTIFDRFSETKKKARLLAIKERLELEYPSVRIHEFPMDIYQSSQPQPINLPSGPPYFPQQDFRYPTPLTPLMDIDVNMNENPSVSSNAPRNILASRLEQDYVEMNFMEPEMIPPAPVAAPQGQNGQPQSGDVFFQQFRHHLNQKNTRWNNSLYLTPVESSASRYQMRPPTDANQQSTTNPTFGAQSPPHFPLPSTRNLSQEFENLSSNPAMQVSGNNTTGAAMAAAAAAQHFASNIMSSFALATAAAVPPNANHPHPPYANLNQPCGYNCCYLPSCPKHRSGPGLCQPYPMNTMQMPVHPHQQHCPQPQHGMVPHSHNPMRYYIPTPANCAGNRDVGYWYNSGCSTTAAPAHCLTPRMPGQNSIQLPSPPNSPTQPHPSSPERLNGIDPGGNGNGHYGIPFERNGTLSRSPVNSPRSRRRQSQRRAPNNSPPNGNVQQSDPIRVASCPILSNGSQFSGGFPLFTRGYVGFQITYSPQPTQDRRVIIPPGRITHPLVSLVPLNREGTSSRVTLTFEVHRV